MSEQRLASHDFHPILRLTGLEQVLYDPVSRDRFIVTVDGELVIPRRSFVALLGPSGCGKTTLLTVLGLLRGATNGSRLKSFEAWFHDSAEPFDLADVWRRNRSSLATRLRRQRMGFCLQSGELLSSLTVFENIASPLRLNGAGSARIRHRVQELLNVFGLRGLEGRRLARLSGGQYQRVALARAVVHSPDILFVDEPTASLNRDMAREALHELRKATFEPRTPSTVVMITHDDRLADEFCDRIIRMEPVPGQPAGRVVQFQ